MTHAPCRRFRSLLASDRRRGDTGWVPTAIRHLLRVGAAVALTAILVGPSAHATTALGSPHLGHGPVTMVPGHGSSDWLMMGPRCGASLS
jgi:hypothetical protein